MQEHIVLNNHVTKALPCIKPQQTAAKTISKAQKTLRFQPVILRATFKFWTEKTVKKSLFLLCLSHGFKF